MKTIEMSLKYFDWLCSLSQADVEKHEDLKREAVNEKQYVGEPICGSRSKEP